LRKYCTIQRVSACVNKIYHRCLRPFALFWAQPQKWNNPDRMVETQLLGIHLVLLILSRLRLGKGSPLYFSVPKTLRSVRDVRSNVAILLHFVFYAISSQD